MAGDQNGTIRRRCIFFVGGYDPKTPQAFFDRLAREMRRSEATWGVEASITQISAGSPDVGTATVATSKDDEWQVVTDFNFLGLDPITRTDMARPLALRVYRYLRAFFDYWLSGAAFSIFARSWRFGLYFLYPFAVTAFLFLAVLFASSAILRLAGADVPGAPVVIALLALLPLLATLGERWSATHLMDLWSFSLEYLRGRRPKAEALMERYAQLAVETVKAGDFDEVVFVGHSTGGGLILDLAARAIKADPELAQRAPHVCLLTLGSTALKFGLHPAAAAFRDRVQSLVDEPRLKWWEFQCMMDVINFYRTDPVIEMGLRPRPRDASPRFPMTYRIHLRDMLDPAAYKRIKRRFFRIHYQFIFANTLQYYYDFFMICFGPNPLSAISSVAVIDIPAEQKADS